MKTCSYCGRQTIDEAVQCPECGTAEFKGLEGSPPEEESKEPRYAIPPLPPEDADHEWATLLKCRSLAEADFIVSDLKGAGIESIVPDQFMIEAGAFRVQVSPKDYEAARTLLNEDAAEA